MFIRNILEADQHFGKCTYSLSCQMLDDRIITLEFGNYEAGGYHSIKRGEYVPQ